MCKYGGVQQENTPPVSFTFNIDSFMIDDNESRSFYVIILQFFQDLGT